MQTASRAAGTNLNLSRARTRSTGAAGPRSPRSPRDVLYAGSPRQRLDDCEIHDVPKGIKLVGKRMASIPNVVYNKTEKKARKGRLEITEHYIVFIKVVYGANAIRNISRDSESANKSQHQRLTFQVRESRKGGLRRSLSGSKPLSYSFTFNQSEKFDEVARALATKQIEIKDDILAGQQL